MRVLTIAVAILIATAVLGCASADSSFVFTAAPYTVLAQTVCPGPACTNVYALSETCDWYAADQLMVRVDSNRSAAFRSWAEKLGFEVVDESTPGPSLRAHVKTPMPTSVLLRVPVGSVPDAIRLVSKRHGVVSASANGSLWIPESVPEFIKECERKRHPGAYPGQQGPLAGN